MMNPKFPTKVLLHVLLITTALSSMIPSSSSSSTTKSLRVDFIHRDSPRSPFYNASQTQYERARAALSRFSPAMARLIHSSPLLSGGADPPRSRLHPDSAEYLMEVSIGSSNPPFKLMGIADTGSDLFWTNCKPCNKCYKQNQPLFDPNASSTYRSLSCATDRCSAYDGAISCGTQMECRFNYGYGDKSYTIGLLSSETLTFSTSSGQHVSFPNTIFRCSHETGGSFAPTEAGIIGLGGGPLSIISQFGHSIDNKFSYCLVPNSDVNSSSTLTFGPAATTDLKVVSTPMLSNHSDTYYTFFLKSFDVGNTSVQVAKDPNVVTPNFFIDSGTPPLVLPSTVKNGLVNAISTAVKQKPAKDPNGGSALCYNIPSGSLETGSGLPDVNLKMANDVTVSLPPANTFVKVGDNLFCLCVVDAGNISMSILGNIAQENFMIEYDLGKKLISFVPMDCTKY